MTPLAAYSVLIANENERKNTTPSYASVPTSPSLSSRIAKALAARARATRSAAPQPA